MKVRKKVLITSADWQASVTVLRSLGSAGLEVSLIEAEPYRAAAYSKYCKEQLISPPEYKHEEFYRFVLGLVKQKHYDVLIPISDACTEISSKNQRELSRYVHMFIPLYEQIQLANDKNKTYRFALTNNIPIPSTYFLKTINDVRTLAQQDVFPCVMKKPHGSAGVGVRFAQDKREVLDFYKEPQTIRDWPILQKFCDGDLYGITAMCSEGRMLSAFMFKTRQQYGRTGTPPYSFSMRDQFLYEEAEKLVRKLNWSGPIDLDYLYDKEKGYQLLEINPRFSGTTPFAYQLGVDLPLMYYKLAVGESVPGRGLAAYKENIMFRSVFPEEVKWCYVNRNQRGVFLRNFFKRNTKTNIYLDDPGLVFWQAKNAKWACQKMNKKSKI